MTFNTRRTYTEKHITDNTLFIKCHENHLQYLLPFRFFYYDHVSNYSFANGNSQRGIRKQYYHYVGLSLELLDENLVNIIVVHTYCLSNYKDTQSSAVITRSNIAKYYINNYRNWGRVSIRCWVHKRHPIPSPNGRAMRCHLRIFVSKLTAF